MGLVVVVAALAVGKLVAATSAAAAIGGALVGLTFRGAAAAWREERDAAVDKADRLEQKVTEQAGQIMALEMKVGELEKRTNYDVYAERSGLEHRRILEALDALKRGLDANTVAVEFLIKQTFPTSFAPPDAA